MNAQEIFDKVMGHLRKQGERSINNNDACLYRGPGSLQCAIGCLIPDELYSSQMERLSLSIVHGILSRAGIFEKSAFPLLRDLLTLHDHYYPRKGWIGKGHQSGRDHGLAVTGR